MADLKSIGSKIIKGAQGIIDDNFKPGKSDSKLQRGRDPVLGSFRLQNRSRVNVGKEGTDALGGVKLKTQTPDNSTGPGKNDPAGRVAVKQNGSVIPRGESGTALNRDNIDLNQYDIRYGQPTLFAAANFVGAFQIEAAMRDRAESKRGGAEAFPGSTLKLEAQDKEKKFIKRKLEERSHLMFEYKTKNDGTLRAFLPFSENIKITENQQSNLADYSLLSRSSQLFAYMGANSTNLKISFSFKLLHILEMIKHEGIDPRFSIHHTDYNQTNLNYRNFTGEPIPTKINHAEIHKKYYQSQLNDFTYENLNFEQQYGFTDLGLRKFPGTDTNINKAINSIIYWINLVRSTTKNNSKNTTFGPPLVKLTHGPMYNSIPCIVKSFNIEIDESCGYDTETLFPRGINVSMDLMETRIGNFSEFKSFHKIEGDNISGWEAIFDENNMDPYNGIIGR